MACAPLPRWVDQRAPASTAARIWSPVAAVWPIEATTPSATIARIYGIASSYSGDTVTIRMRPPAASCQRRYSAMSGGRMNSSGCAPRGPSSRAMCGPSTWIPTTDAAMSGSRSHAPATARSEASIRCSDSVQIVIAAAATPVRHIERTIASTTSGDASAPFGSWPSKPLIWRSIQPGPIQRSAGAASIRSIAATIPSRTVIRTAPPSSIRRPSTISSAAGAPAGRPAQRARLGCHAVAASPSGRSA